MPNFVEIAQTAADFSIWRPTPSWILKMSDFYVSEWSKGSNVSLCQISRRSVKPFLRHDDFSSFQDGGRRHVGFLNF